MVPGLDAHALVDALALPLPAAAVPLRRAGRVTDAGPGEPEYELVDTGAFADDRYWAVTVDYAKADPTDLCMRITVENRGPDPAALHVLPTLWFRNTWAWGLPGQDAVPRISADGDGTLLAEHAQLGSLVLIGEPGGTPLLCDNESNAERLWGVPGRSAYPKDGINDHVVHGSPTVNPDRIGTKGALWYRLDVPAGGTSVLRVRLSAGTTVAGEAGLTARSTP